MSIVNVIRCDLPLNDFLVWKWQSEKDSKTRQNQIRYGSSVRVRTGETAVFFYSPGGAEASLDYIDGPADLILETKNLPVISSIIGMVYGGDSPFQAEIYFINKGKAIQLNWGVPWFDAFDLRFQDIPVPVCANGTITFEIADIKKFVEIQGLRLSDPNSLREQIIPQIRMAVKSRMVGLAGERGIPLVQIGGRLEDLSIGLQPTVIKVLEGFGVSLRNFVVEGIEIDKDSEGYRDLASITRRQIVETYKTQGHLVRENMVEAQAINSNHVEESLAIQRRQQEKLQKLQTETDFSPAHVINLTADVNKTVAESIGKLGGAGGSGGVSGIVPTILAAGMALPLGQAFGQKLVGSMEQMGAPTLKCSSPSCNQTLPSGAKFCLSCGNSTTPIRCNNPSCNQSLQSGAKFCSSCGTSTAPSKCKNPSCNQFLPAGARFCPACGTSGAPL